MLSLKSHSWPSAKYVSFSSPELKACVSFSDRLASVVRPSVRLSVRLLTKFKISSSPKPPDQFQPNLAQITLR